MKFAQVDRGSVVLVAFPFTDLTATKVRPALVLSPRESHRRHPDVILAAISSVVPAGRVPACVVLRVGDEGFAASGLRVTSVIHCAKVVTVQSTLLLKHLGHLVPETMRRVEASLRGALGL